MAMSRYRGVSGIARKVTKRYRGVDGVSRKITKGYRGVDGVSRKYFEDTSHFVLRTAMEIGQLNATAVHDVHANILRDEKKFDLCVHVQNSTTSTASAYVSFALCQILQNSPEFDFSGKALSFTVDTSGLSGYKDLHIQMFSEDTRLADHRIYDDGTYSYTIPTGTTGVGLYLATGCQGDAYITATFTNVTIGGVSVFSDTTII